MMSNFRTRLILTAGSVMLAATAFAADVAMNVQPQLIGLLDRAVLKVEFIDCKGDALDIPDIEGLDIQYQGRSSETRFVNFKSTSKVIHTYIITPSKTGDYTIGPLTAVFNGGSKELTGQLRVIENADDADGQTLSEMLFSRISSDRKEPYVQEPFRLKLNVFVREGVQIDGSFSIRGGLPESGVDGELQWQVSDRKREELNGSIFTVYTLNTTTKTLTAGLFKFQPQVQVNVVVPRQQRRSYGFEDPFFGDFFGRQEKRPIVLDCNPLEIKVRPVPLQGRPDGFTGGVGVFDFNAEVAPTSVKAGEPITVKMSISGDGNLSKITPPVLAGDHDFKLYDARAVPADRPDEVRFEQVVIPKSDTVTNLPPLAFSYFNTKTADFRTITRGPFPITVEAAQQQTAAMITAHPGTAQQETRILGYDIVYLKPQPPAWTFESEVFWYRSAAFKIYMAVPALLLILIGGMATHRNTLAGNVARARRQKAPKTARKHLRRAEQAMQTADETLFYEAMWLALTDYFANRLNLAPGDVTKESVLARFTEQPENIESLFDDIEQRRYGIQPTANGSQDLMPSLLHRLTSTLKQCEKVKL